MSRLSIVIPSFDRLDLLEETLVGVLQHRPDDCEVLVVHDGSYEDTYDLADEVRFVTVPSGSGLVERANAALGEARGLVVNYLAGGVLVTPNWTDSAMGFFEDPQVALVTPKLVDAKSDTIACVGIQQSWLGNRTLVGHGKSNERSSLSRIKSTLPNLACGFFRRSQLLSVHGFDASYGDELADLVTGQKLVELGGEAVVDVDSCLEVKDVDEPPRTSARILGRNQQRWLAAQKDTTGSLRYWMATAGSITLETLTAPRSPRRLLTAWGRLAELRSGDAAADTSTSVHDDEMPLDSHDVSLLSIDEARDRNAEKSESYAAPTRRAA